MESHSLTAATVTGEREVVLRDGSTIRVRPIRASDEHHLREFLDTLSDQSRRLRYFGAVNNAVLDGEAHRQSVPRDARSFGIIAIIGADGRIIAHAECDVVSADRAEVAFAVADDYQGMSIGSILLQRLAEIAPTRGITNFEAWVLPENERMMGVFRDSGFPIQTESVPGQLRIAFPIGARAPKPPASSVQRGARAQRPREKRRMKYLGSGDTGLS
jgi:GNAT superfamily N-acetyltransferase